jgi:polyribonucleotide nucleotidyltransferase
MVVLTVSMISGKAGSTLKRLKHETGTRIDVQKGEDFVKIKGTDENIERAKTAIDALVAEASNPLYSELSIPSC